MEEIKFIGIMPFNSAKLIYYQCYKYLFALQSIMTTQIRIFQKCEPKVQRGQLKNCQICNTKFSVFVAEHQCKRCLRAVCSSCSSNKRDVYKPKMVKSQHRLCKICTIQSTILSEYSQLNKLKYGHDSQVALKWAKKLPKIPKATKQQSPGKQNKKFTLQIFKQLWDSYNFSLRQFIGLHTFSQDQQNVYRTVNKVYVNLQQQGVDEKLENIIYFIVFLLCFSSVQTCTQLVYYLTTLKKQVADQKQFLQAYLKNLGLIQQDIKKVSDFINYEIKHYLGNYSINAVTSQCSIHVISKAFQKQRIDQSYMLLAIIIYDNFQFIQKFKTDKTVCDFQIVKKCDMSKYLDKFKTLTQVKVAQFINTSINSNTTTNTNTNIISNNINSNEDEGRLRQSAAINPASVIRSPGSTPPKPVFNRNDSIEQNPFEIAEIDQKVTAKQRALQNIARIKAKNDQLSKQQEQQKSEQSVDKGEENNKMQANKFQKSQQKKSITKDQSERKRSRQNKMEMEVSNQKEENMDDVFAQFNKAFLGVKNIEPVNKESKLKIQTNTKTNEMMVAKSKQKKSDHSRDRSVQKQKVRRKNSLSPKQGSTYGKKQPIVHYQKQQCFECNVKSEKIQQLYETIRIKSEELETNYRLLKSTENQLQKMKIEVKEYRQKQHQKERRSQKSESAEQMQKLRADYMEGVERYNALMKDALRFQKQNKMLKNEVEQTTLNNKLLKSKLEQASMGVGFSTRNNQKQQQLSRENQLLKKSIQSKNKQLQLLSKKNKEFSAQIEQLLKTQTTPIKQEQKSRMLEKQKQDLIRKMKELGQQIVKEEQQKLGLSSELFQLKRTQSLMPQIKRTSEVKVEQVESKGGMDGIKGRVSECNIF